MNSPARLGAGAFTCLACLILTTLTLQATPAHALPRHSPVPGGVAVIPLDSQGPTPPKARYGEAPLAVVQENGRWYALLGIPLDTVPGRLAINVEQGKSSRSLALEVQPKDYPTQRLTIRNQRQVTPNPEDELRIDREKEVTDGLKRRFSDSAPATAFQLPAQGRLSSRFGLRRFFNGEPRNPHAGLDVAVGTGSPIRAPAAGTVINIGNYFFNGNTVFLDHGQGLVTAYMHLSRVEVKEGERVEQGTLLGAAGATGRVTGPHLHWAVFLNGTAVEPEVFLARP
ncbi:MAG TPA: peptidoglycan DD-metalloendopeptidase family protein [Azospira sp.]|nr:peptidoglycan DD-metalloendopeptidase family protein [Azospira sp.]